MSKTKTIGLLSDIHANAVALEAVLEDMPDVDALVHAGDVIGYGPSPNECIELLREHDAQSVRGNHDEALFNGPAYESGDEYAQRTVTAKNREWLADCPTEMRLFGGRLKVVHGNPIKRFQYTYRADFRAELLDGEEVLLLGHTHKQGKAEFDDGVIVNPGSIGQPRDGDNRAAYAVLNLNTMSVTLERVSYDIQQVVEQIDDTPISTRNGQRLNTAR
jgi:putative phosphoesterase